MKVQADPDQALALIRDNPGITQREIALRIVGGMKAVRLLYREGFVYRTHPGGNSPKDTQWWPGPRPRYVVTNSETRWLVDVNRPSRIRSQ